MDLVIEKQEQFRLCDNTIGQIWYISLKAQEDEQVYFVESSLGLNFELEIESEEPINIVHKQEEETLVFDIRRCDGDTTLSFETPDVMDFLAVYLNRNEDMTVKDYEMQIYINFDDPNPFIPESAQ